MRRGLCKQRPYISAEPTDNEQRTMNDEQWPLPLIFG
jgi:hypothetical protein